MICMGLIGFGKGIPYDCEIEYLESTGTQWIRNLLITDGVKPFTVEYDIKISTNNVRYLEGISPSQNAYWGVNIRNEYELGGTSSILAGNRDIIRFYSTTNTSSLCTLKLDINGSLKISKLSNSVLSNGRLGLAVMGESITYRNSAKYYTVKINFNNDEIIRDLIPVRKGNIGYMYDRISGQFFGNDGTGAFILGPDKPLVKIAIGEFKPTAKSYVQDGLVAMWDGIENAGWGVHDQNATVWKNLVGEEDIEFNQSFDYDIDEDSVLFHDNDKAGRRAYSKMAITMTNDMTIEGMMLVPNVSLIWDFRMCIGLLNDQKTGIFPFARGENNFIPALKYSATYNDGTDRYFGPATKGETTSSTVVFRRADKLFDGYYNGAFVSSIGSQEDNWLGDNLILNPTFLYKQLSGNMIGSDIRVHYMRIYSRVLTTEEISRNYQIDKMRFGL